MTNEERIETCCGEREEGEVGVVGPGAAPSVEAEEESGVKGAESKEDFGGAIAEDSRDGEEGGDGGDEGGEEEDAGRGEEVVDGVREEPEFSALLGEEAEAGGGVGFHAGGREEGMEDGGEAHPEGEEDEGERECDR